MHTELMMCEVEMPELLVVEGGAALFDPIVCMVAAIGAAIAAGIVYLMK